MSSFITALIKQRRQAKKAQPDTHGRFKEIIAVLKKYDYDDGITPEITVNILQDLGPTFVKIGQIASQQAEHLPPEYCEALSKLRSKVAPMDMETVHSQIEKHLGKPTSELFASFDDQPLGSASIAQVHKAKLFDGTDVAVKVRRPGIVDTVARDFALIEKFLDKFTKKGKGLNLRDMIVELEHTSKIELDLTNEANNLERFWKNNVGREMVKTPKCYPELSCEAILTEDFATGKEVSDAGFLSTLGDEERERIAALVADNFATQVLTDGFYHADPHSGNVLIQPTVSGTPDVEPTSGGSTQTNTDIQTAGDISDSDDEQIPLPEHSIEWIDFGMMGTLSQQQRQIIFDLVTNVVMQDAYTLKQTLLKVAQPNGEFDHGAILEMCEGICGQYNGADFGDFDLGDLLNTVMGGLQDENFKIDPFLTNLARGIIAMEGTIKTLSPNVNILNYFTNKVDMGLGFNLDLDDPKNMNPEIALKLVKLFQGITNSSTKTAEALDMLEKGQIRVRTDFCFEQKALDTVNRAIRALIIVAVLIGSCLLCMTSAFTTGDPIFTIIFRVIGFAGIIVSIILACRMLSDMKKGK